MLTTTEAQQRGYQQVRSKRQKLTEKKRRQKERRAAERREGSADEDRPEDDAPPHSLSTSSPHHWTVGLQCPS